MRRIILTVFGATLLLGPQVSDIQAQEDPAAARASARAAATQRYQANLKAHADDRNMLVKPGLVASKKDRRVVIDAVATGLPASDPVEFFLIPEDSGKDYEALAVAFAKPSDIDQALRFIGMTPGRPVDFAAMNYWPKGPRVLMRFQWGRGDAHDDRAERFVLDTRTNRHLPLAGFVYAGSTWRTDPQTKDRVFAADVSDSMSIASNYNEPTTILDVPRRAPQGDVYSHYKPNPKFELSAGQPIRVILEPEPRRLPRVVDLDLHLKPGAAKTPEALNGLTVDLVDQSDSAVLKEGKVTEALAKFADLVHAEQDPYVTIHIDGRIPLGLVRQFNKLMLAAEGERGIRIEAPPADQLYPRAFVPNPRWRDRKTRLFTAFELLIEPTDNSGYKARLLETYDRFTAEHPPTMTKAEHEITDGEQLAELIGQADPIGRNAIVVIADDRVGYKRLMALLGPILKTNPQIHVFPLRGR
jgi:hypothetical protein